MQRQGSPARTAGDGLEPGCWAKDGLTGVIVQVVSVEANQVRVRSELGREWSVARFLLSIADAPAPARRPKSATESGT
ncbi:hypothetical protein [Mangrovactinospora gilvigrisea]|uniref:hypothetical protein n=1 Tax=Mangrovactinospora gilvigrisea TaxID=1428644 RepID=UPI0011146F14|nr:hypothetical protein [Mangrovactinospora gilvigrisea]